jgi:hypothetical protein
MDEHQLYMDAVAGCKCPHDQPYLETLALIEFCGNQHNPYDYKWSKEALKKLNIEQLKSIYKEFSV